ncbi:MAG: hypothetical protein CVU49_05385 [Candidatus Cloacimonetes bacterium HGW-Cloacimonetes-2]|jgi:hypothetical protein|nr:MAG: hypothetical protein CVU49_05385 [Candidatus Cloacimonetes bacterium HGW-Cloacimonetes-2]
MKRSLLIIVLAYAAVFLSATGVVVNRLSTSFEIARLNTCDFEVNVSNQTAQVKVTESFTNTSPWRIMPRLYFPLPRGANPNTLRWNYGDQWHQAYIGGVPQGAPGGPTQFPDNFIVYIQLMPVIFDAPDSLESGASIIFELSYVQQLNSNFGSFTLNLKNDYQLMQAAPLARQSLNLNLQSIEQITDFDILDINAQTSFTGNTASATFNLLNQPANNNYRCIWQLQTGNPTSWGLSTMLDEAPDGQAPGFFLYNLTEESIPADSTYALRINLVIDVSGSMTFEDRLTNAKQAAIYVINNLGPNDYFNIILFDHVTHPLWSALRPNTFPNRSQAISFINSYTITSLNGTNLYAGLQQALHQFTPPAQGIKNCVMLLSDGQPNVGVTDTYEIVTRVNSHVATYHIEPYIFCFGVGSEVNYQLLNALAQHHRGLAIFLESAEITTVIPSFYDVMRNPTLQSAIITIGPAGSALEIFPDPVPTIYGGMQYRILGRYTVPQNLAISVDGYHEGDFVSFNYDYQLSAADSTSLGFIPKLWASAKIDKLLIDYYQLSPGSPQAVALRQQIIDLSIDYQVVCIFTSFVIDPPVENDEELNSPLCPIKQLKNYPNPFNPSTTISFEVSSDLYEDAELRIYNVRGQLVYIKKIRLNGKGLYEVRWDGKDLQDRAVSSGLYIYTLRVGDYILHSKMTLSK